MSNYDLEEIKLLKWQFLFSSLFIISTTISLTITHNEILKRKNEKTLYTSKEEANILKLNRILASIIALSFIIINVVDKKIKKKYNECNENIANANITASALTLIATLIVLYLAFYKDNDNIENPEL